MHYETAEEIFDEMRILTPSYAGITYKRIEKKGIPWPCPSEEHPGTPILHIGQFSHGKGKFFHVDYREAFESPDIDYPFILTTGRSLYHYHTASMTRRSHALNVHQPRNVVQINPKSATQLGIADQDLVRLSSRRGSIELHAELSDALPEMTLFTYFHFAESPANALTHAEAFDPIAGIPEYKVSAAKLEKI